MKRSFLFAILGLCVAMAMTFFFYQSKPTLSGIPVWGSIEVREVRVGFKLPGRILHRFVDEGEFVVEGQKIAELDSFDLRQKVAIQTSETAFAKAFFEEMEHGFQREKIREAEGYLEEVKASYHQLEEDFHRQSRLLKEKVISPREYEVITSEYKMAKAKVTEATASLKLLQAGVREEKVRQAQAKYEQALHLQKIAENNLQEAILRSPFDGVVLSDHVEAGEWIDSGTPIVTLGDLSEVKFRGYIQESDLGKVKLNQVVEVRTDSYPDKVYRGKITFISSRAEFTPKDIQVNSERVRLVYRIKVVIPNPHQELKAGMAVDGLIETGS